jgi:quercetin dioxygenase-like cupin family protein
MNNFKKVSITLAGVLLSSFCLSMKAAYANEQPLNLPDDVFLSRTLLPTGLNDSVFVDGKFTNDQYSVIDGFVQSFGGPEIHKHFSAGEAFWLQRGSAAFQLNERTFVANAGDFVFIPPNALHSWVSLGDGDALMKPLVILNPANLLGYLQDLRQGLLTGGTQGYLETVVTSASKYNSEVPSSLLFESFKYLINEDGSSTTGVTVRRIGKSDEAASASIYLSGGTATFGEDYNIREIPINFAPQEITQVVSIPIPLINDGIIEGNETVNLTITNPLGTIISPLQSKSILSIFDNNAPSDSNNANASITKEELQELYGWETLQQPKTQIPSFWLGGGLATVIADKDDTNNAYSLFDVSIPGVTAFKNYFNPQESNAFYILDGKVSFKIDGQKIELNPGNFFYISAGRDYEFANLSNTSARIAVLSTTKIPEPSVISALLVLVASGAVSMCKGKYLKLKYYKLQLNTNGNRVKTELESF